MGWMIRPDYGLIRVSGQDALEFLQGQLSNDVRNLAPNHAVRAAYCTPQGRVLALITLLPREDGALMLLPADLVDPVLRRLTMYVMRARVSLESVDCQGRLLSANILPGRISQRDDVMSDKSGMGWVSSVDPPLAWRLLNSADSEPACMPHDENLARLWQIQAGLPEITGPASGQFIPQMLNLDLLDGVSFRKGCYTGQEIVTRTQHLGRIKRRLVRIAGPGTAPAPGTGVDSAGRGVGQVLTSANDRSGYTALAILQIEAVNTLEHSGPLLTGGVPVKLVPLPYAVPELRARNS